MGPPTRLIHRVCAVVCRGEKYDKNYSLALDKAIKIVAAPIHEKCAVIGALLQSG